jgi:hypothetical protein
MCKDCGDIFPDECTCMQYSGGLHLADRMNVISSKNKSQWTQVTRKIKEAAKMGEYCIIWVKEELREDVKEKLLQERFQIMYDSNKNAKIYW